MTSRVRLAKKTQPPCPALPQLAKRGLGHDLTGTPCKKISATVPCLAPPRPTPPSLSGISTAPLAVYESLFLPQLTAMLREWQ